MFLPRIRTQTLAGICFRLGTSLTAGIDIRRCLEREVERSSGATRLKLQGVFATVQRGGSLTDAFAEAGSFFPPLFQQMVRIGEATGGLNQILLKLAEFLEHVLRSRRQLIRSLAWPMFELGLTLSIVGLMIWLPEVLPRIDGKMQDMLGFGWVGNVGLAKYGAALGLMGAVFVTLVIGLRQDRFGARWIVQVLERLPVVGPPIRDLALGRAAWSLSLTTNTPMDVKESLSLALESSLLPRIVRQGPDIALGIDRGQSLYDTLVSTRQFPDDFLDAVDVGEQTGMLSESLTRLSASYDERSRYAIQKLSTIAGVIIWLLVAAVIISLIFRLFGNYVAQINALT